jgi:2'-5' RNA ligase
MKRLFIAINLPEETHTTITDFLEPYKSHAALLHAKWVSSESQHVTVLFLGETPDRLLPDIREFTRGVCGRMQAFPLEHPHVTLFPPKLRAKMLWLRYTKSLAFEEFAGELKRYLLLVLPKLNEEENELIPHVTLARLKESIDPKTLSFKSIVLPSLQVNGATLYETVTTPEGSSYSVIDTFPFGF